VTLRLKRGENSDVPRPADPDDLSSPRNPDLAQGDGQPPGAGRDVRASAPGSRRHRMLRWTCALVTAAVLSGFAFLLLTGDYINEGPVLATVSQDHGIHSGDLWIVAGWAVAMVTLITLAATPGPE
jgi:hypothetical protein